MESSGCLEVPRALRDMFKSVSTMHGGQCVALTGTLKMAMLCVDSWDLYHEVFLVVSVTLG